MSIDTDLKDTNSKLNELTKELNQIQKWQDRMWDVVKWVGGISAGLSISAAIALVGLVIKLAVSLEQKIKLRRRRSPRLQQPLPRSRP